MNACSGAHFFVGNPRNIDILLRALLLELHPTLPPSHTCLAMKQVLVLESGNLPWEGPVAGNPAINSGNKMAVRACRLQRLAP